jgi:nitronate monooxygenase
VPLTEFALGYLDVNALRSDLDLARSVFNNDTKALSTSTLPIGVGYLGWILDEQSEPSEKITVALENRVAAVWFSFGNDLGKWINFVREYDSQRVEQHKTLVFVLVNTLEEALKAAEIWKVDVLIAQGAFTHSRKSIRVNRKHSLEQVTKLAAMGIPKRHR